MARVNLLFPVVSGSAALSFRPSTPLFTSRKIQFPNLHPYYFDLTTLDPMSPLVCRRRKIEALLGRGLLFEARDGWDTTRHRRIAR